MGVVRPALLPTEIIWIRWPPPWGAVLIYGLENQSMQSAPVTRQALRFGNLLSSFRGGVSANAESYRKQIFKIPRCAIAHLRSGAGASSRNDASGYFIDDDLVGDAAQRRLLLNRDDRLLVQDGGDRRRLDHRPGDVNLLRGRQALNPSGDIDCLAEIILPLVEHDGTTRTFMNPPLLPQIPGAALCIQPIHGGAHPQAGDDRMFVPDEGRHHGIADGLDHGAFLRGYDLQQRIKMRAHQVERGEISDPLVERGGSL